MSHSRSQRLMASIIALATIGCSARAQDCKNGKWGPDLGIKAEWRPLRQDGVGRSVGFGSIPVVRGVRSNGPAARRFEVGDSIVSIAGTNGTNAVGPFDITSLAAWKLFAGQEIGTPLRFGVRRSGKPIDITIIPVGVCHEAPVEVGKSEVAKAKANREALKKGTVISDFAVPLEDASLAPEANMKIGGYLFPAGWFGFSIRCVDCIALPDETQKDVMFRTPPSVNRVEPNSPAEKAGIRGGDVLTHIDGVQLASMEGTERFRSVKPGQTVRFRFTRDGKVNDISLQAVARPDLLDERKMAMARWPSNNMDKTRYKGILGDVAIEAFGAPVSVKETDDEIIIESKMLVVRLKKVPPGAKQAVKKSRQE
jgi:S1-C subfamily serine protease